MSRDNAPFLHGKAGVITAADGTTSSFVGSVNETASGWKHSYEIIWEDRSPESAAWVRDEFEWLWSLGCRCRRRLSTRSAGWRAGSRSASTTSRWTLWR